MSTSRRRLFAAAMIALAVFGPRTLPWGACAEPTPAPDRTAVDRYGDPLPKGAVARLGTVRFRGANGQLHGLAFLSDGQTLAAVDGENIIRFWETSTGRLRRQIVAAEPLYVSAVVFSPNGRQVAVSGMKVNAAGHGTFQHVVRLVDATSGKEVRSFARKDKSDQALAFTPDGKYLFSFGDGVVRIEESATGTELLRQKVGRNIVRPSLLLSPDGKTAVWSGPNSGNLFLWDWQAGEGPREQKVPGRGAYYLSFSPDGKTLAAANQLESEYCLWDVASGKLLKRIPLSDDITISGLAFHPDGKSLAVADSANRRRNRGNGGVLLVERQTGKILSQLPTPGLLAGRPVFSTDGRWLAAVGGGVVHVWDLRDGSAVAVCEGGHQGSITQIVAAKEGRIATASDDHTVRVWDAATGAERAKLMHHNWVRGVALSPDGRWAASSGLDDFVRLWDLQTGKERYRLAGHGELGGKRTVRFLPDSQRFLSFGDDYYLRIWDVRTGKALVENAVRLPGMAILNENEEGGDRRALARQELLLIMGPSEFTPDGKHLVLPFQSAFHLVNPSTGRVGHTLENPGGHVISLAVSPDSRLFAVSAWGKMLQKKLADGRTQFTTPEYHLVCLGEVATGKLLKKLHMPTTNAGPVAFSPDNKLLAVGFGRDGGEIHLLDVTTGEAVAVLKHFGSKAHALAFSPDGKYLISGLENTSSLVWDLPRLLAESAKKEGPP